MEIEGIVADFEHKIELVKMQKLEILFSKLRPDSRTDSISLDSIDTSQVKEPNESYSLHRFFAAFLRQKPANQKHMSRKYFITNMLAAASHNKFGVASILYDEEIAEIQRSLQNILAKNQLRNQFSHQPLLVRAISPAVPVQKPAYDIPQRSFSNCSSIYAPLPPASSTTTATAAAAAVTYDCSSFQDANDIQNEYDCHYPNRGRSSSISSCSIQSASERFPVCLLDRFFERQDESFNTTYQQQQENFNNNNKKQLFFENNNQKQEQLAKDGQRSFPTRTSIDFVKNADNEFIPHIGLNLSAVVSQQQKQKQLSQISQRNIRTPPPLSISEIEQQQQQILLPSHRIQTNSSTSRILNTNRLTTNMTAVSMHENCRMNAEIGQNNQFSRLSKSEQQQEIIKNNGNDRVVKGFKQEVMNKAIGLNDDLMELEGTIKRIEKTNLSPLAQEGTNCYDTFFQTASSNPPTSKQQYFQQPAQQQPSNHLREVQTKEVPIDILRIVSNKLAGSSNALSNVKSQSIRKQSLVVEKQLQPQKQIPKFLQIPQGQGATAPDSGRNAKENSCNQQQKSTSLSQLLAKKNVINKQSSKQIKNSHNSSQNNKLQHSTDNNQLQQVQLMQQPQQEQQIAIQLTSAMKARQSEKKLQISQKENNPNSTVTQSQSYTSIRKLGNSSFAASKKFDNNSHSNSKCKSNIEPHQTAGVIHPQAPLPTQSAVTHIASAGKLRSSHSNPPLSQQQVLSIKKPIAPKNTIPTRMRSASLLECKKSMSNQNRSGSLTTTTTKKKVIGRKMNMNSNPNILEQPNSLSTSACFQEIEADEKIERYFTTDCSPDQRKKEENRISPDIPLSEQFKNSTTEKPSQVDQEELLMRQNLLEIQNEKQRLLMEEQAVIEELKKSGLAYLNGGKVLENILNALNYEKVPKINENNNLPVQSNKEQNLNIEIQQKKDQITPAILNHSNNLQQHDNSFERGSFVYYSVKSPEADNNENKEQKEYCSGGQSVYIESSPSF